MSEWELETETTRRFDVLTGAPQICTHFWLKRAGKREALVVEDSEKAKNLGRFIAATLNNASPYIEATDLPLDPDAFDEAMEAVGSDPQQFTTLRDLLNFVELKYAAVLERHREMTDDGEGDLARKEFA